MTSQKNDGEVLEGFLCPICMEDLVSITQLQSHFEKKHETEDKAGLLSFKGLISKAKKKFLNDDEEDNLFSRRLLNPFSSDVSEFPVNDSWDWEVPYTVPCRNHFDEFNSTRSQRIDSYVAETNKLLIRLDKLLNQLPSDITKRKAHEREIVSWVENKDVPLCPFCAKSFNIARRRHHCRLCGAIMCDDCSQFLPISYAEKLISPVHHGSPGVTPRTIPSSSDEKSSTVSLGALFSALPVLKRSNSQGSLNSILSSVEQNFSTERAFRICDHCLNRLTTREKQVEHRSSKTLLTVLYSKLMEHRKQLLNCLPQYNKMVDSFIDGETTYHYSDAEQLRMRILQLSDTISITAQKIRNLGASGVALDSQEITVTADGEKVPAYPRQEILQRRIHSSTVAFLKEKVLGLSKLPTKEEVLFNQERRRKEMETRVTFEREASRAVDERAAQARRKRTNDEGSKLSPRNRSSPSSQDSLSPREKAITVNFDNGWGPDRSAHRVTETDDPVVQQMNVIRNYMRQAREARKYDELAILEENLKELQIEFKRRQSNVSF